MDYNWTEIFKNKTTRELYDIYLGKSTLGPEQIEYARKELESRNFDFVNLDKQRKKWELERLIEEEKSTYFGPFRSPRSWEYLIMVFGGLLTILITLISLLQYYINHKPIGDTTSAFFGLIFGVAFVLVGFLNFRKSRKREAFRKKRQRELIDEL